VFFVFYTHNGDFAQLDRYLDYERTALRPVERQGGTQSTAPHSVISGHQRSSAFTFTLRNQVHTQVEARRRQRGPELGVGSMVWAKL